MCQFCFNQRKNATQRNKQRLNFYPFRYLFKVLFQLPHLLLPLKTFPRSVNWRVNNGWSQRGQLIEQIVRGVFHPHFKTHSPFYKNISVLSGFFLPLCHFSVISIWSFNQHIHCIFSNRSIGHNWDYYWTVSNMGNCSYKVWGILL